MDKECVAWVRCFWVPMHVWNADFFAKLLESIGTYLYSDDNTEKRRSLDVACIKIHTTSTVSLNQSIQVNINNVNFSINIVEE